MEAVSIGGLSANASGADASGLLPALYFSAVTATSVGYGDIIPHGLARFVAIVEAVSGLVIFGGVVSKFVSTRQEQLIGEIHRIAFEDRLGRIRTNLHLVRTEVQATTAMCEGHAVAPPAAQTRFESISLIFVGELRVIHDLLYQPSQTPDEQSLENILSSLASILHEFSQLVACVGPRESHRPAIQTALKSMVNLSGEICGDCVPRQHAPALRVWMDDIQRTSRELVQI